MSETTHTGPLLPPVSRIEMDRTTRHVADYIDCSYRQLNRWATLHLFGTGSEWAPGSGGRVTFEDHHIEWAWTCARLTEMGAQLDVLGDVVRFLDRHSGDMTPGRVTPGDVLIVFEDGTCMMWRRTDVLPAAPCWCVPLSTVEEILTEWSDRHSVTGR